MEAMIIFIVLSLCLIIVSTQSIVNNSQEDLERIWCRTMKIKYSIEPGQSFGKLPQKLHNLYLNTKCYRFFCEYHELFGKGKFACQYLPHALDFLKDEIVGQRKLLDNGSFDYLLRKYKLPDDIPDDFARKFLSDENFRINFLPYTDTWLNRSNITDEIYNNYNSRIKPQLTQDLNSNIKLSLN